VWLDGIEMVRGSEADYVIDYSRSEIYFNPRRIIREGARIVIDYESRRNEDSHHFYFARSSVDLGSRTSMAVSFLNEGYSSVESESPSGPSGTQPVLSAGDGDWVDGGRFVGPSMGTYIRVDLDTLSYYEFVGEGLGDYQVTFTRVGDGGGRYSYIHSDEFGTYIHVYTGSGDYVDMVRRPPRIKARVVHLRAATRVLPWLEVESEAARSEGHMQAGDTWKMETDRAYIVGLKASHDLPSAGGLALGRLDVEAGRRSVGPAYITFDRMRRPDFLETWAQEPGGGFEKSNHLGVTHEVGEVLRTDFEVGSLETGAGDSYRYSAGTSLGDDRLGITATTRSARMTADGTLRRSEANTLGLTVPIRPVRLSAGRNFELRARLQDSTSTRRTEYYSRADLGGDRRRIRLDLSTISEERDVGQGWTAFSSVVEGRFGFDAKAGKTLSVRGGVSQRRISYSKRWGLPDSRATGADFHLNLRDLSAISTLSMDYRLSNTLSTVYAMKLVRVESGDYDSLGNYLPGVGGHALSRYETGKRPVTQVKAGLVLELGRKGKVILDRSVSSRTVVDIEGESSGGQVERAALLESGYLLNGPGAVFGRVDLRQEVVMRRNRALTVAMSARGSRLLDARTSGRREQMKTLEVSMRVSSSGFKGVSTRLETRRVASESEWDTGTGLVRPTRTTWGAVLDLKKNVGTGLEGRMKLEMTDEDRTEPGSETLEARVAPGLTFFAGPVRCDANMGMKRVLRSHVETAAALPKRDSVDWNSRINTRHGKYTSLSVEYSGHRYKGFPAVHNFRASLSAAF
jgi:hypothetical protein